MYLRALDSISSRCSATVSFVMRGKLSIAWSSLASGATRFGSFGFLKTFLIFCFIEFVVYLRSRVIGSCINPLISQNFQNFFLNFCWLVHLVDNQVSYQRLHHNCTKSEHRLL